MVLLAHLKAIVAAAKAPDEDDGGAEDGDGEGEGGAPGTADDETEKRLVQESGLNAYTMRDIDERGMKAVMEDALSHATNNTAGVHMSFDLDGMDPSQVPGVGTAVRGGINWREGCLIMEMLSDSGKMVSIEVTELNPILDVRNQSGDVAVDLICSAFGKSIL